MTANEGSLTSYSNMSINVTISSSHKSLIIIYGNKLVFNPRH